MANAQGLDISRYDKTFEPSKALIHIDFAIQKLTEGVTWVDPTIESHWQGVKQIEIRGGYHYQKSGMSWLSQADAFLYQANKHDYHIYALDLESYGNLYNDTFFSDTKRILDYWKKSAPTKKVILYTNADGYKQLYYALIRLYGSNIVEWLDNIPLWYANPTTAGKPPLPLVRKTWHIHQYAWDGDPLTWGTGGTDVDENEFNGDIIKMREWVGITQTPPPPPTTGEDMLEGTVTTSKLNIRNAANSTATIIGALFLGDKVYGVEEVPGWLHFGKIVRANGTVEIFDGYSSTGYMTLVPTTDPGTPKHVLEVTLDGTVVYHKDLW